ncbi:Zn(2)-C6 fungal-type DNA-binding domain protein [Cordyceps fumosorosea ARSEF 2679]|uniref:Zn(2)-C6 fungal-type DNA-binding domain protein n=1 Tax=Cordyceps fumosorosea (strain ARSEF 2679) TaxID=1081104 RepID=A0A167M8E0_CORFA|nr:Zn(2)-C6 fungal-type DNA-binding domain protein [Cordyceps fumosorosea ARSEF 2679]OAA54062.1 Zn(2)-C6 fungal-type DNA-binding domain protein [Cordyceps fumosorosea ARSEF 2679]
MVYPGTRSTGCGQCRKRKIKCDEARPGCRRCQKSGIECPGYYRPLELRFHTDGGNLLHASSLKKGSSSSADTTSSAASASSAADRQQALLLPPRLGLQPEPLWEKESALYFYQEYCIPPSPDVFSGFLNFLPNIVLQSEAGSTLRAASAASACLALSRRSKSAHLYQRACSHYGAALRGLNTALGSDASVIWNDETIASIMLMNLFEDIHGKPFKNRASHLTALIQVFSMRNIKILQAPALSPLYRWALLHIQIRSFYTGESFDCVKIPKRDISREDLSTGLSILVAQINQFSSEWIHESTDLDDSRHKPQAFNAPAPEEAWRIQTQLDLWMDNLPPIVKRRTLTTSSGTITTASTRMLGITWSFYDAALVVFYTAVIACCRAEQGPSAETLMALASSRLTESLDAICRSIPYNMGEVDRRGRHVATPQCKAGSAYYIILPLGLVTHSQYSSERHRGLCNEALEKIRERHGLIHEGSCVEMLI